MPFNGNPSRLGQVNNAGAIDATFLQVFSGEVLAAFQQTQVTGDKHIVRSIDHGRSATFPLTGRTSGRYHEPGQFIQGQDVAQAERVISIDGKLIAPTEISDIDDAKNHYDIRKIYTSEMGQTLANTMDKNVLRSGVLGSRDPAQIVNTVPGGSVIVDPDANTQVGNLVQAIANSQVQLSENLVPEDGRYTYVRPLQYALLTQSTAVTDRDLGGVGSFAMGNAGPILGTGIIKTVNLPNVDDSATAEIFPKYRGDYSTVVALTMHTSAVGTVKLMDMAMEMEWDVRRQTYFMLAKYAMGHDYLRTSAAISVETALPVGAVEADLTNTVNPRF